MGPRSRSALGADCRRGPHHVLDRDRHPDAGREQTAPHRRRPGEFRGIAVSGSGGRAALGHDGRILGRGPGWTGLGARRRAGPGWIGAGRAGRVRSPRAQALFPFRRRNEEPGILHGGVSAGGAGRWTGRRGEPSVDGAWRLCGGAPAGRDRISTRDRSDDRAVPGLAPRALFRFGRRRDQSRVHRCAAWPHPRPCRGAGGGEGPHAVRAGARVPAAAPRGRRDVAVARAGRGVRLRHDRRCAGRRPHRSRDWRRR